MEALFAGVTLALVIALVYPLLVFMEAAHQWMAIRFVKRESGMGWWK